MARRDGVNGAVGVFYYFSDHLKTASVITDATGTIKAESDYYPWGGELQFVNTDTNHYKFTGKERDTETGLDYFGARYYSNGLGRWVSADWSATPIPVAYADFGDPQSLNLYSYVRNIPTTKIDADGHCDISKSWCQLVNYIGCFCAPVKPVPLPPSLANEANRIADKVAPVLKKLAPVAAAMGLMTKSEQFEANKQQGKDFEKKVVNDTQKTDTNVSEQVTVKTQSGVKTRIDVASQNESGKVRLREAKSSATAPLTSKQAEAFPEIQQSGATVVGKGKPGFPGGMRIPPTKVEIVRPPIILE